MNGSEGPSVAVFGVSPLMYRGLVATLAEQKLHAVEPDDIVDWVESADEAPLIVLGMHDSSLIERIRSRRPDAVVVALLPHGDSSEYARALSAGAQSSLSYEAMPEQIVEALRFALRGVSLVPTEAAMALASHYPNNERRNVSEDEITWLRGLATGKSIDALAGDASYSSRHFKRILRQLYGKLGAANRSEALVKASRMGLIDLKEEL